MCICSELKALIKELITGKSQKVLISAAVFIFFISLILIPPATCDQLFKSMQDPSNISVSPRNPNSIPPTFSKLPQIPKNIFPRHMAPPGVMVDHTPAQTPKGCPFPIPGHNIPKNMLGMHDDSSKSVIIGGETYYEPYSGCGFDCHSEITNVKLPYMPPDPRPQAPTLPSTPEQIEIEKEEDRYNNAPAPWEREGLEHQDWWEGDTWDPSNTEHYKP